MMFKVVALALVAVVAAKTNWVDPQKGAARPSTYKFKDTLVEGMKPVEPTTWTDDSCPKCQFREHGGELVVEVVHGNYKSSEPDHLIGAKLAKTAEPGAQRKLGNAQWNPAEDHKCYADSIDSQDPSLCPNDSGVTGYVFSHNGRWTKQISFHADTATVQECAMRCDANKPCDSFARFRDGNCYLYASAKQETWEDNLSARGKKQHINGCWHWWSAIGRGRTAEGKTAKCAEEPTKSCTSASDGCTSSGDKDGQVMYSPAHWGGNGENIADWVAFEKCRPGKGFMKESDIDVGTNKCSCVCGGVTKTFTYTGKYATEKKRFINGHGTISPDGNLRAKQLAIDQYQKGRKAKSRVSPTTSMLMKHLLEEKRRKQGGSS